MMMILDPSFQKQISSGMKLIDVCNYTNEAIYIDITNSKKNSKKIENFSYAVRYKFFNFYAKQKKEDENDENDEDDEDDEDDDDDDYEEDDEDDDDYDDDDYDDDDDYGCYEKCDDYEYHRDDITDLLHCESVSNKNIVDKLIFDIFYYHPTNNFTYHISITKIFDLFTYHISIQ